ncbi:MAG: endonuclease III [Clostridiaceae bacterium]|nr:endonuclease III [Clostridiaceae bacterium]
MLSKAKVNIILSILEEMYPVAECSLDFDGNDFHFLVRAILSAQCTDKRVNEVTKTLFDKYPSVSSFAQAQQEALAKDIKTCGLYNSKSRNIIKTSQILEEMYDGQIPIESEDLESLPGVGRKVANLIRGELFSIPAVVVDTHCMRVAKRLDFADSDQPLRVEKDLSSCVPKDKWITLGHRFVAHGRALCSARSPKCNSCALEEVCKYGRSQARKR